MGEHFIKNIQKISEILELMISEKIEIKIRIGGKKDTFKSRLINLSSGSSQSTISNASGNKAELIMEKLIPDEGNSLVQSSPDIMVECTLGSRFLSFDTRYCGISSTYPYFGIIVVLPESLKLKEMRREERTPLEMPELISVEFKLAGATGKERLYQLNVFDCTRHGLGLLVTDKEFELLHTLNQGDKIKDMTFYATWAIIKVDGTLKHMTKINSGQHKGRYILGVESSDIIENCKPPAK